MNFGIFIEEINTLVLSPQWQNHERTMIDFKSVGHNFGLKTIEGTMIIGATVKFVINSDGKSISFGSKWKSTSVDMDHVFVWKNDMLTNVLDKDQLIGFMGRDKFVPAF